MNTQEIVKLIHSKFHDALKAKTSWGRIELGIVFNNITIEVLALAVDKAVEDKPQDKYDSIVFENAQQQEESLMSMSDEDYAEFWDK